MSTDTPPLLLAYQYRQARRMPEAEALCRQILAKDPNTPGALYLLGLIASDAGAYGPAIALIQRSLSLSPQVPASLLASMYYHLGYAHQMAGQDREAVASYDQTIRLQPDYANAYANKGVLLRRLGADQEAIENYLQAIRLTPNAPETYYNLGNALRDVGQKTGARASFEKALEFLPDGVKIPLQAAIHNNLGQNYADSGNHRQAIGHFQQAIALTPDSPEAYYNYANVLRDQGQHKECLALYAKALELKPAYPEARLASTMAHIPLLFDHDSDIDPSRLLFEKELEDLERWFDEERIKLGYLAVGASQPFFLAYQERNNQPLLSKYGRLCENLMLDWATKHQLSLAVTRKPGPLRLGIVSSHFHDHSVWHAIIKGWLRHFDRQKIITHVFYVDQLVDDETRWARENVASFQHLGMDVGAAVQSILSKELDVLIYPEIGMGPTALKLASLRLCSFQMTSWGHPETSGLPTMDYYLSAEDFEPREAEAYYAEKLVRLPHLGCCYQPLVIPEKTVDLASLGLRSDLPILLSPGMVFKYTPANDHVFVDLARKIGPCQIVFFVGRLDVLTAKFKKRLENAFAAANLPFETSCVFIPWQDRPSFYSLLRQATVFLDTIGFSGFNTAIQAIECGLPVVTREGRFMRGRLASGILKRMGLPELVTNTNAAYVDKVVELVQNAAYQKTIRRQIVELRATLFEDLAPVEALQSLLIRLVNPS